MVRRGKNRLIEDDLSESGSESSDAGLDDLSGDEKLEALLNNPSARRQASKKRKRAGAGGVKGFTEEDMDDAPGQGSNKRYHKMPSFVASGSKQTEEVDNLAAPESLSELLKPSEQVGEDDDDEEDDDDRMDESEVSSDTDSDQSPASRLLPEETAPRAGLGANMPSSFGRQQQFGTEPKRSFLHAQPKTSFLPSKQPANLTNDEKRHFAKLESTGGIGFKMLSKMGWDTGTGLGAGGEGRVNPVDSQQRPINMGIGYQGFKEKTKQSLQEARRRGEHVSDEEEEQKPKARRRQQPKHEDKPAEKAWKAPPRAKKTQVRHMTYEEVLAQQSADQLGSASVDAGLGQIIDISGAELPSLPSSLSANVPVPTSDTTRLPELRHNVRLIAEGAKSELDHLAKEGIIVSQKQQTIKEEQKSAKAVLDMEVKRISTLEHIINTVQGLNSLSTTVVKRSATPAEAFQAFTESFQQLTNLEEEYKAYRLDEALVAAIVPVMRMAWRSWDVLENPTSAGLDQLKSWQRVLRVVEEQPKASSADEDFYFPKADNAEREMTPYEAMMWSEWLPRIRSALNNDWDVTDAQPAVNLFTAWSPILPAFIRDNMLDQLILPKVSKSLSNWTPKSNYSLHSVVVPWLEHAGSKMGELLEEAKRSLKAWFRGWRAKEGVLEGMHIWKDLYSEDQWNDLVLKYILPVLGGHIKNNYNPPSAKDERVLQDVVAWQPYLRSNMLDQLLGGEVISKWLDALWIWLTAPEANLVEIANWYNWWKEWFGSHSVGDMTSIKEGMEQALYMMDQAEQLGADVQFRLAKPTKRSLNNTERPKSSKKTSNAKPTMGHPSEVSFRSIVEEEAAMADLLFQPANRSHPSNGLPLFRVSKADKKAGGVLLFIKDDVVWAAEGGDWHPVGISELMQKAKGG